jgi:hypothetical protein
MMMMMVAACVQVLCKSQSERERVIAAISEAFPDMDCMPLTLKRAADFDEDQPAVQNPVAESGGGAARVTEARLTAAERVVRKIVPPHTCKLLPVSSEMQHGACAMNC